MLGGNAQYEEKWQERIQILFCKFHECPGRWTEHCKSLMNSIEDLIQRGYFKQYRPGEETHKRQQSGGSKRKEEPAGKEDV